MFRKSTIISFLGLFVVLILGWLSWRYYLSADASEVVLAPKTGTDCVVETASSHKPEYDNFATKNAGLFFVQAPESLYTFQRAGLNIVFEKNAYISSKDPNKKLESLLKEEWQNASYNFNNNPKIVLEKVEGVATLYPLHPDYTEYKEIVFSDNRLENLLRLDPSAKLVATLTGEVPNFDKANVRGVAYFLISTGNEAKPVRLNVFMKDIDGVVHKIAQVCIKVKSRTGEDQMAYSQPGVSVNTPTPFSLPSEEISGQKPAYTPTIFSTLSPSPSLTQTVPKASSPSLTPGATSISRKLPSQALKGDADLDGKLTYADVDLTIKMSVGIIKPTTSQLSLLDLDGDGKITARDAEKILALIANTEQKPICTNKNGLGDVNGDGRCDGLDVELILAFTTGRLQPSVNQKKAADLNADGVITIADAQLLLASIKDLIAYQTKKVILGDVNGDSLVNNDDFELLKKIVDKSVMASSLQIAAGDLNKDGLVTSQDLETFQREFLASKTAANKYPSPSPSAYVYVRLGSSHPDIKIIKSTLNREGLYNGTIDELFDRELQDALIKFQKKYSLPATGKLNFATIKKLNELNSVYGLLPQIENRSPSFIERIKNLFSLVVAWFRGR